MQIEELLTDFEVAINEGVRLYREGDYGEARIIAGDLLCNGKGSSVEQLVRAALLSSMIARAERKFSESLQTLRNVAQLVRSCSETVQGKYHNALGATHYYLKNYDAAFQEYTAACVFHEKAGVPTMRWEVENNLGLIVIDMGKPADAYEYLDRAAAGCNDPLIRAQIDDTYARAKLAEGVGNGDLDKFMEALGYAISSVTYCKNAGELGQLEASAKTLRLVCEQIEAHREGERIREALERAGGKVSRAAEILGIHHKTLSEKLKFKKFARVKDGRQPTRRPRGISVSKTPA